ncbi:hypothetical protein GIB67_029185 [Kingdonia uniflora]|uniref:Transposase-associated domain-containing protein n=1 Tax=Kingdonia uniflora TaxID=39325 RepID=A0A7J7LRY3_9MAGN|nr:hypothetical protein GIB67_029185 [Kingdonia uniflora]
MMDRNWITIPFCGPNYIDSQYLAGIETFFDFAHIHLPGKRNISCPCIRCGNRRIPVSYYEVRYDLLKNAVLPTYSVWDFHGEKVVTDDSFTPPIFQPAHDENLVPQEVEDILNEAEFTESDDMDFHDIVRGPLAFVTRFMDSNTTTGNDTLGSIGGAKKKRGPSRGPTSLPDRRKRNDPRKAGGKIYKVKSYQKREGYEMSLVSDDYLKKKIVSSWRLNKCRLRTKYITGHDPVDVKAHPTPPPFVPGDDWHMFVDICNSAKHMASSTRNKVNRSKLKAPICVRRRSLLVIRHMLAMKRKLNSDALVARSEVYLTAHTKRDNTVQCPELAEKIMAIERLEPHLKFTSVDDSLAKVFHRHLNKKCTLNSQKDRGVARGEVVAVDPDTLIHNVLLGNGFYKILLSKVMKPRTLLSKDDGYSEDLSDVGEGAYVAWAIWCLEFDE